jgi:hypothetical protein
VTVQLGRQADGCGGAAPPHAGRAGVREGRAGAGAGAVLHIGGAERKRYAESAARMGCAGLRGTGVMLSQYSMVA